MKIACVSVLPLFIYYSKKNFVANLLEIKLQKLKFYECNKGKYLTLWLGIKNFNIIYNYLIIFINCVNYKAFNLVNSIKIKLFLKCIVLFKTNSDCNVILLL